VENGGSTATDNVLKASQNQSMPLTQGREKDAKEKSARLSIKSAGKAMPGSKRFKAGRGLTRRKKGT